MSKITEITAARQEQATRLASLIDQTAEAFKELDASTMVLRQSVYPLGKGPNSVHGTQIHGMDNLHTRVKSLIQWKLYGDGDGRTIDLINIVDIENQSAVRLEALHHGK